MASSCMPLTNSSGRAMAASGAPFGAVHGDLFGHAVEVILRVGATAGEVLGAVLRQVHRDAENPGRQLGFAAKGADGLEHLNEHLLRQILGFVTPPDESVRASRRPGARRP